jgi:hypothetical protein
VVEEFALRWTVTILFVISAGECLVTTFARRRNPTIVVGNLLHVLMALAMAVMAWPWGAQLPTTPPMVFFLLAAVWFLTVIIRARSGPQFRNLYHLVMMLSMAWMYALMNGNVLPGQTTDSASSTPPPDHSDMHTSALDRHSQEALGTDGVHGWVELPAWINAVNWVFAVGFAVATAYWFYRYVTKARGEFSGDSLELAQDRLGVLCQAMMAGGAATMFGLLI